MQHVVLALLGCCCVVVAHAASLSDTLSLPKTGVFEEKSLGSQLGEPSNTGLYSTVDNFREKRSGSGGFFSGIGSAILGKVAQASSGISKGSSDGSSSYSSGHGEHHEYESVAYGAPVHNYEESDFDIWSFKKAIINTLFQALKAIGGGVIALKGKLIKGGGIVVSAKGNIISAKGEAISHLGRQIAASAILTPPQTGQSYVHETPVHHVASGHGSYAGPPPSAYLSHGGYVPSGGSSDHAYGHSAYASPSDDAENPGLLILRSLSGTNKDHGHDEHQTSYGSHQSGGGGGGGFGELVQSIGAKKNSLLKNIAGKIAGTLDSGAGFKNLVNGESAKTSEIKYDVSHSVEHVKQNENYGGLSYAPIVSSVHGNDDHSLTIPESHVIHKEGDSLGGAYLNGGQFDSMTGHGSLANLDHGQISYQQQYEKRNVNENENGNGNGNGNRNTDFVGLYAGIGNHYSHDNDHAGGSVAAAIAGDGHLMIAVPSAMKTALLQPSGNQQPLYFSQSAHDNLQLQNFNRYNPTAHSYSYNGILRRDSRAGSRQNAPNVQIIPSIGYVFKNSKVYRI